MAKKKTPSTKRPARKSARKKRTVGRPAKPREVCFVIMPFGGWLDDYYETIYSPAIEAAGLEPHRADDLTDRVRLSMISGLILKVPNYYLPI